MAAQEATRRKPIVLNQEIPVGPPNQLGEQQTIKKQVLVDPDTMEILEPKSGGTTAKLLYTQLAADKKSVVDKHFAGRADVTPTEVAEFIKNLK